MALAPLSEEGGYFKETFRSPQTVSTPDREGGERNLFTTIYYMISPELGGKNYLHSNKSDNVHYFHDGWPAKYILVSPKGDVEEHVLGCNTSKGHVLQLRVPGGFLKAGKILEEEECATFPEEKPFNFERFRIGDMKHRKDNYISQLGLIPLSEEGGYFVETYRSPDIIQAKEREGNERSLFTTIYYMIAPELGGKNFLNSNKSDITHFFHDGWPAKYIYVTAEGKVEEFVLGSDTSKGHVPQRTVPGGCLKAAEILLDENDYAKFEGEIPFTLISEGMSPGFDYRDRCVPKASEVKALYPELWPVLKDYSAPDHDN